MSHPLPFAKVLPWDADPDDEGQPFPMLRSRIPVERYVVVCPYMIGAVEHLMFLSPVLWGCADAEAALEQHVEQFPDAAVIAFTSMVEVGNPAHDEALLQACRRLGGWHSKRLH